MLSGVRRRSNASIDSVSTPQSSHSASMRWRSQVPNWGSSATTRNRIAAVTRRSALLVRGGEAHAHVRTLRHGYAIAHHRRVAPAAQRGDGALVKGHARLGVHHHDVLHRSVRGHGELQLDPAGHQLFQRALRIDRFHLADALQGRLGNDGVLLFRRLGCRYWRCASGAGCGAGAATAARPALRRAPAIRARDGAARPVPGRRC